MNTWVFLVALYMGELMQLFWPAQWWLLVILLCISVAFVIVELRGQKTQQGGAK